MDGLIYLQTSYKTKIMEILIAGGVVLLIVIIMYNGLINKKNQVENVFAGMDAQLKKRYDLIPNLISTVKTYMKHEKDTLLKITELRAKAISGKMSNDEKIELNNMMSSALGGIMVAVENYPELKALENFIMLQESLNDVEEQISAARRYYNTAITSYNNAIEMFPTNILAKIMSLERKQVFNIIQSERENINAGDLFNN